MPTTALFARRHPINLPPYNPLRTGNCGDTISLLAYLVRGMSEAEYQTSRITKVVLTGIRELVSKTGVQVIDFSRSE